MKKSIITNFSCFIFLVVSFCVPQALADNLKKGDLAIGFRAKTLAGQKLSLADFKGKVVLLDFWATWCGPCRKETPNIIYAYNTYHELGLEIISISLDNEKARLDEYIKEKDLPWHQVFNGKGWDDSIAKEYAVKSIPTQILLDRDLKVHTLKARGYRLQKALMELFGSDNPFEKHALKLEELKLDKDEEGFNKVAKEFSDVLIKDAHFLNEMAWNWVDHENKYYEASVIVARKAVDLHPEANNILDTLAYAELKAGYLDKSIEHFAKCVDNGMESSGPRLATALAMRAKPDDLEKACSILEQATKEKQENKYIGEALGALKKAPVNAKMNLKQRIDNLLITNHRDIVSASGPAP